MEAAKILDVPADRLAHLPLSAQRSQPTLRLFSPVGIPYQQKVLKLVRKEFDYRSGNLEILLSGSYGSAKSVLLAHLAVTHCMMYPRARVAIVRRALPDIKATIFKEIIEHIENDLVEGVDYWVNNARGSIRFKNKSEIVSVFWADRRYKRVRSLKLSMVIIEEATENDTQDMEGFEAIKARLRRLPHVPENVLVCATNPDSPAHWLYDYFIVPNQGGKVHRTRRVFYSITEHNVYLDPVYIQQLRRDTPAKAARRFLNGEWIELTKDQVYYEYSPTENYRQSAYEVDLREPVYLSWDFNIGVGKPLSVCLFQLVDDEIHYFAEVVVEGMRTLNSLDELAARGLLDLDVPEFLVCGDAAGKHRDTRNIRSDYDIINSFLANYKRPDGEGITFRSLVPLANPPIRKRHNLVNAYCYNGEGRRRLFVYEACAMLHKGFRLVELKKGGDLTEDDSKDYQHVTTAAGYGLASALVNLNRKTQGSIRL